MSVLQPKSERVNRLVQKFEEAWRETGQPQLSLHLGEEGELRNEALWELVSVDLEFRIKANEAARVEDYLKEYPELLQEGYEERLADFIAWEYRLRSRREPGLDPSEYRRRFPNQDCGFVGDEVAADSARTRIATGSSRFRLVCPLAEGGLGKIWQGYDSELDREVAIKEIKHRFADDDLARRRFNNEARITSHLEHPGIVPIHGTGTFPDGRPYYAMRYVRGVSLSDAIRQLHGKTGSEFDFELRLLLGRFVSACETIHYAHDNGVLHRDIKPSNIMLGDHGETFVLDWGLAKRIGANDDVAGVATPQLPATAFGMSTVDGCTIGSPSYMSPEQARGEHKTLTAASDIFSLGATLCSMLTEKPPISGGTPNSVLEKVRAGEVPPVLPARRDVPRALRAISEKAMAQNPNDRYETVRQLSEDIERYLADEAVRAFPDTRTMLLARFARKNRPTVSVVALASTLLCFIGLIAGSMLYTKSRESAAITDYLVEAILQTDLNGKKDDSLADALLSSLSDDADSKLARLPLNRARCAGAFAHAFSSFGHLNESLEAAELAYQIYRQQLGETAVKTLDAERLYAAVLLDKSEVSKATLHLEHAVENLERLCRDDATELLSARYELARARHTVGQWELVLPTLTELLPHARASQDGPNLLINVLKLKASIHTKMSEFAPAEELYEEALAHSIELNGARSPRSLYFRTCLGETYRLQRRFKEAVNLLEEVCHQSLDALGEDHPQTEYARRQLADCFKDQGRYQEALPIYESSLAASQVRNGNQNIKTLGPRRGLATNCEAIGDYEKALEMYRINYSIAHKQYGARSAGCLVAKHNIAKIDSRRGQFDQSLPALAEVAEGVARLYGETNPATLRVLGNFIESQIAAGSLETGALDLENLVSKMRQKGGWHADLQHNLLRLAEVKNRLGNHDAARVICREILENWQATAPTDVLQKAATQLQLAESLIAADEFESAKSLIVDATEVADRAESIDEPDMVWRSGESALGRILSARIAITADQFAEAEALLNEANEIFRSIQLNAIYAHRNREMRDAFVALYQAWGKPDRAKEWQTD